MADAFLDALGVKDPTAAAAPAKAAAGAPQRDPFDLAVRLAMLEERDPSARKWVAGVMANRGKADKGGLLGALTAPNAFEPLKSRREELEAIDPNSDDYKATAAAILPILQGKAPDPSGGALNFYAPDANAQLAEQDGRPATPSFDDGKGVKVGNTLFFGGQGKAPDSFLATLGVDPEKAAAAQAGDVEPVALSLRDRVQMKGDEDLSAGQLALKKALVQGGAYREDDQAGTPYNPYFLQKGAGVNAVPAGAFYVDYGDDGQAPLENLVAGGEGKAVAATGAKMRRAPGGEQDSSFMAGLGQGGADVITTLSHMMPGSDDSTIKNRLLANQAIYGAQYGGDVKSGLGRFTGQVAASVPLLGAGEAAAAPVLGRLGAAGEFLAGEGGLNMAPSVGRFLTRAGSLATKGAAEGAGATGLVSSADDAPVGVQMLEGAAGGALLGPALPAVGAAGRWAGQTVRDITEPLTATGRDRIASRLIESFGEGGNMVPDAREIIPGSVPTLAQATGNPGIATLERTVRLGRPGPFNVVDDRAAEARSAALDAQRGDEHTVADLAALRQPLVDEARNRAFANPSPTDPAAVVSAIDAALASPEAHMESVARPLAALRDKLVSPAPEASAADVAALHRKAGATFGAEGDAFTPEVMDAARAKLGAKFEDIAGRTNLIVDPEFTNGLNSVVHDASQVIEEGKVKPLQNLVDQINSTVQDGQISGASYKALIRRNGPLDILQRNGDGAMRHYASQIREHLDDALERTMASDFPADRFPRAPKPYDPNAAAAEAELAGKATPAPAAAPVLDDTDKALNLLRARKEGGGGKGPRLADALIKKGGLNDSGTGDLADLGGADYGKRGGLLVRGKGMTLEDAATLAADQGYIPQQLEPDGSFDATKHVPALLAALRQDLDGKAPVFSQGPTVSDAVKAHADELEEMLGEMGIDPAGTPNGRIKQQMAEYFGTSAPEAAAPSAAPPVNAPAVAVSEADAAENAARGKAALEELRATRLGYKNLKTVEMALRSSGVDRTVTPRALYNAVKQNFTSYAYKGGGPLGEVAEAAMKAEGSRAPVVESHPAQIHGMRDSLSGSIDKLEAEGSDESLRAAARLKEVRGHMDTAIEKGAPGYTAFLDLAERSKEPVEATRFLQSLKLTDKNEAPTLSRVTSALDRIHQMRNRPGKNPAKLVSDATVHQLEALKEDLARADQLSKGRPLGPDTAQHFVTNNIASNMNVPLAVTGIGAAIGGHPLGVAAIGAGRMFYGMKNQQVLDALASRLVRPEAIEHIERAAPAQISGPLRRFVSPVLPATGGLLSSRLLGS